MILLKRIVFLIVILFCLTGCLESSFQLSKESRLPKWFVVPEGMNREDFTVQMELFSTFSGGEVVIKISQNDALFRIQKYTITSDEQPSIRSSQLKSPPKGFPKGYPRYKVLTVNGITDVIELRKMEPVFYMTDDPAILKELGVEPKPKTGRSKTWEQSGNNRGQTPNKSLQRERIPWGATASQNSPT